MDNNSILINMTILQGERTVDNTKIVLYSILLVWSLIGNAMVITVVSWNIDMRTIFNGWIVNMAVSDLFVPLLALPLNIVQSSKGGYREWLVDGILGKALCKLCYFFSNISPAVSVFSLIIIAVNRFIAIVFPALLKQWSRKIQVVLIVLTWVTSMALFSPYFYTFRLVTHSSGFIQCLNLWTPAFDDIQARTVFISIIVIALFFVPFLTITILYALMLKKLVQKSKAVANSLTKRHLCYRARRNKKIFYLSATTVVTFLILWGPFFCFLLTANFIWRWNYPPSKLSVLKTITFALQYLGYLNSAINPCIYFLFLKAYKEGLIKLLSDKTSTIKRREKREHQRSSI